ncbi:PIG-L deacetylase family protein [Salinicoccus roseus]|uniref:PIG-L deacetylase family protein n=1 Tax=Salinicoccus roseus TaxID=45670 RepID=UPI000F4D8782|nr:PIG-L deacetylase family protein [Salinicoccus roseus]RPE54750.1 LmbE family N-acetylglucosaminyl deacetylase [Salinicoccus roseus]GGA62942.1 LmbE family protein [Salinicoccus roseus]
MNILVFAPHNDDEVLGAGGTIAKYAGKGHDVYICEVTSGPEPDKVEALKAEARAAHAVLGVKDVRFLELPMIALRHTPTAEINAKFHEIVIEVQPEIVFLPHKGDMNFDHAETTYAAMVALRPFNVPNLREILVYETLSETEWNTPTMDNAFMPNVYVDISGTIERKLKAMECYGSQLKDYPHPRSLEAIRALSMVRGTTICAEHAESFMLIRSIKR